MAVRLPRKTAVVDIGSAFLEAPESWQPMLDAGLCTVIGFEPQPEQLKALLEKAGPDESYRDDVIADGQKHILYTTTYAGTTSILEIDREALKLFQFENDWVVKDVREVQTSKLDDVIFPDQNCDFLRMDVQGSEAMILENAHDTLKECVAIQLEMSWIPIYKGQRSIGEMDVMLRDMGFMPHKCIGVRPAGLSGSTNPQESQIYEGDFVYIRDLRSHMTFDQWNHLALLAAMVFRSADLHYHCLNRAEQVKMLDDAWRARTREEYRDSKVASVARHLEITESAARELLASRGTL